MKDLWKQAMEKIKPESSAFQVLIYLAFSKDACKPAEISKATGLPPGTIRPTLRTLLKMGFVNQETNGLYESKVPFTDIIADVFLRLLQK